MNASNTSSRIFGFLNHSFRIPFSSIWIHLYISSFIAIFASVSPLTSFVRALVRNPSFCCSYLSNRNFVITNPNTESPMNSSVSNDSKFSFSFNADLCVKAFWYKSILDIFVPTRVSTDSLSMIILYD